MQIWNIIRYRQEIRIGFLASRPDLQFPASYYQELWDQRGFFYRRKMFWRCKCCNFILPITIWWYNHMFASSINASAVGWCTAINDITVYFIKGAWNKCLNWSTSGQRMTGCLWWEPLSSSILCHVFPMQGGHMYFDMQRCYYYNSE